MTSDHVSVYLTTTGESLHIAQVAGLLHFFLLLHRRHPSVANECTWVARNGHGAHCVELD